MLKRFKLFALLILFASSLAACQDGTPTLAIPTPAEFLTTSAAPSSTPESHPAHSPTPLSPAEQPTATPVQESLPNTQYTLTATLNYFLHHLAVEQKIQYFNRTTEAIPDLLLMVEPMYYPGVFKLNSLTWEDGQEVAGYTWEGSQLRLPLAQPLSPGQSAILSLTYELNLPSPTPSPTTRPVPFGYTARQTNLVDWYPFIPPYVPGQGWMAHPAGYFGEHLAYEIADFQVNIQISDARSDLVIAASAAEEIDGPWHRYQHPSARNFAWSVSHDYHVLTETVGSVTVKGYAFPIHPSAGEMALKTTARALALYNEIFGPYPHQTLSVVEADFLDGMEYDGLYFLSNGFYNLFSGKQDDYLTAIAAHETAHQWWYALVGNNQAMEPWLDEALCTYSERIYYERVDPEVLDWWWAYRVNYYQPRGWVDGSIYNPEGYRAYRDAVYLNGAVFLEELRKQVGEEAFFAFLKDYSTQNTHRLATGQDFFTVLKQHTEVDLEPLMKRFFSNSY